MKNLAFAIANYQQMLRPVRTVKLNKKEKIAFVCSTSYFFNSVNNTYHKINIQMTKSEKYENVSLNRKLYIFNFID